MSASFDLCPPIIYSQKNNGNTHLKQIKSGPSLTKTHQWLLISLRVKTIILKCPERLYTITMSYFPYI